MLVIFTTLLVFHIEMLGIIFNDNLKFIPQINFKFNNVDKIDEYLISTLKEELKNIIKKVNFSIIEIKKGSLTVTLALQYIVSNELKKLQDKDDIIFSEISFDNIN